MTSRRRVRVGRSRVLVLITSCVALSGCTVSHDLARLHAQNTNHLDDMVMSSAPDAAASQLDASADASSPAVIPIPVIAIATGEMQGKLVGDTREYLGIPYAKAPVDALRFAPPQALSHWDGMLDVTAFGPSCPQGTSTVAIPGAQSEDCLTLNVFVPNSTTQTGLPVMVFIHGGAFVTGGSSQTRGELLSDAGPVVVVTINYRLGPLGFLALPELDQARSNAPSGSDGIRDQQLALHWVHDNIEVFGGDPHNVTVFGESAGSMSACIHLVSPASSSLRQRVIMESGTCLSGGMAAKTRETGYALSQSLVSDLCGDTGDVLACLRNLPSDQLVGWGVGHDIFGAGWGPTIEGDVLPDKPEVLLAHATDTPAFLIGVNKNEWLYFQLTGRDHMLTSVDDLNTAIETLFGDHASAVEAQYPADDDDDANDVYVDLMTDIRLRCPTRRLLRIAAGAGASGRAYSFEQGAAYHSAELSYVFGDAVRQAFAPDPLQDTMQAYWTAFARTGSPSAPDSPDWPVFDSQTSAYMTLLDPPTVATDFAANCDFWDQLADADRDLVVNPL
jgi:para-nitrobenzyl esterase